MKRKMLFVIVALIILLLLACGIWLYHSHRPAPNPIRISGVLYEDPDAVDIANKPSGTGNKSDSISIPGFDKLTVKAGDETVGCEIFNPPDNPCYFVAVVALEDGTELYRSGLIAPGKAIYSMRLSSPLKAGSYNATLTYECYSFDEIKSELNGAVTHFILEVLP